MHSTPLEAPPNDAAQCLKPKRIAQSGKKRSMPEVQQNAFNDGGTQLGHAVGEPGGVIAAM
jgi:hypothetical protein